MVNIIIQEGGSIKGWIFSEEFMASVICINLLSNKIET